MEIQYLNITTSENKADHTNGIVENINNSILLISTIANFAKWHFTTSLAP